MNLPHNVLVERLTQHSQALALPHGRRVGQPGHDVARKYLLQRMSDHAAFAEAGQPFLFLSCGMGRHYHTPEDTMEWINFDKLAHITCFIGDLVDRIDRTPADADHTTTDPFEIEIRMLRKALGPVLISGLRAFGIKMPESREELDAFVSGLVDGNLIR